MKVAMKRVLIAMVLAVQFGLCTAAMGTPLGLVLDTPMVMYDSTGILTYNPVSHALDVSATPLVFKKSAASPPVLINTPRDFDIHFLVDNSGALMPGGAAWNNLVITGNVQDPAYNGTLLTGQIVDFGYRDNGPSSTVDNYEFIFSVTGGTLAPLFDGADIGIALASEHSNFVGRFDRAFGGGAKGTVGSVTGGGGEPPIAEPATLSWIGIAAWAVMRKKRC